MNISEIIKNNPELAESLVFKVNCCDLKDFAAFCIEEGRKVTPPPKSEDDLLTPGEFAEKLKVSLVTLWSWDKKGITHPVRIGNAKRYRRSDLEKLMQSAK